MERSLPTAEDRNQKSCMVGGVKMFTETDNRSLDEIMKARRICRKFTDRIPDKKDIEAVVEAGRLAPYASISSGDVEMCIRDRRCIYC